MLNRTIAGRYRIVQEIGRGAMGHIWKAFDGKLQRHVALKLMSASHVASPVAKARFEREAQAIAQLQSPHVVQIFDAGIEDGVPYIVMELLSGEDLESRLERLGPTSVTALTRIVNEVAKALTVAHASGIVHRDLKPANIFLAKDDAQHETLKILDFGVVAMLAGQEAGEKLSLTMDGAMVGTPLYMSPEQIRSANIDHRSDLWALGVVLYRALTGTLPFTAPTPGSLMVIVCMDPFEPPSKVVPGLSPAVDAFFDKALAKDVNKRFQTAAELASAWRVLASPEEMRSAKILVVDDEPQIAHLFRMQFRKQVKQGRYNFIFAGDGVQALEALREHADIDVIFTDINMPKMDGLTFLSRISEVNPFARAIVVSAYGDMANIRTAMNRGAFDFLTKPIDFDDLAITAEKTLRVATELRKNAQRSEEYSVLSKFVSPSLLQRVDRHDVGHSVDVVTGTVAFIGLSRPEGPSVERSPEEQLRRLNANFEIIVPTIVHRGGIIHQFSGGVAMVVFLGDDHEKRALDACLDVRAQIHEMALKAGGASPFAEGLSIGVASGDMIIGAIGSNVYDRLDLAVLGDASTEAMYLQLLATKNQILVGADVDTAITGMFDLSPVAKAPLVDKPVALEVVRRVSERAYSDPRVEAATVEELNRSEAIASEVDDSGVRPQGNGKPSPSAFGSSGG